MAKRKPYLLILFFLIFIVSACTNSSDTGAGGDIPLKEAQGEKNAKSEGEAEFLNGKFDFSMMAYLKDFNFGSLAGIPAEDLYPASMISNWGGEFTIAPDGSMSGSGKLITESTFFVVDEDWCGYAYTELADHEFQIGGTLKRVGDQYYLPIKIWSVKSLVPEVVLGPGEAVCNDPGPERNQGLEFFVGIQRDAMVQLITQHLHQSIGDQIEMGIELSAKSPDGNIEYEIMVSPEAVELVE
jgi:hypothetical protein